MGIEIIVDKYKNELPGYTLSGYGEVGFPQYKCRIQCLILKDKRLPVVDEYVLRLYKENISLDDMGTLLGIEQELIKNSWFNLIHLGLIHIETKWITEKGYSYLRENKIDSHERIFMDITIDALSGRIKKNRNFINRKSIREHSLDILPPIISLPSGNNLKVSQLKKIMNEYKINDPENYAGSLLDIIEIDNKPTQFRRLNILVFSNEIGDFRFIVCDDAQRYEEYEDALLNLEESGVKVLNYGIGEYFNESNLEYIRSLLHSNAKTKLSPLEIRNNTHELISQCNKKIYISLPLVKIKTFDDFFVSLLEKKLKENVKVFILTSGREFADTFQKTQYEKLIKLKRKYKNLTIDNTSKFQMSALIADDAGIASYLISHDLKLPTSKLGITETGILLNSNQAEACLKEILSVSKYNKYESNLISKQELTTKLMKIIHLVTDVDEYILNKNNIGWTGGQSLPDVQRLLESPVATSENNFKVFISSIHTSLGESLENNGKSHGDNKYFWNYFKETFPDLHKVLHKIRVYRHSTEHLLLEAKAKKNYFAFLDEDLDGAMPFLKANGYHVLQTKIVLELEQALETLLVSQK
ncbi:hypothetical protein [Bacillus cereus group sp. Bce001]|uniref:hypothetical protein n=1 Tax=Bacillus cereus group sp. Bce001 TaxID=3445260 RepID=UPI003F237C05